MGAFSLRELLAIARSLELGTVLLQLVYPLRRRWYERHYKRDGDAPPQALGRVLAHTVEGRALVVQCQGGVLRLEVLAADLVQLRLQRTGTDQPPFSYALDPDAEWPAVESAVEDGGETLTVRTAQVVCRIDKQSGRADLFDSEGRPLSLDGGGLGFRGAGAFCVRSLAEGEAIYGLAEKALPLNLRGHAAQMWNRDPHCYSSGDDPLYAAIPLLLGLHEGRAYGWLFDNPARAHLDLGRAQPDRLHYRVEAGDLCAYFFAGPTIQAVLERYAQLTGRMLLPPRWLLGYQQSRWSYFPESQVRDLAAELRRRRIPCDVIYLDIHCMDGYRVFTWDRRRFPDPARLLADLRAQGLRVITTVDPGVKVDRGYRVHDEGVAAGAFCTLPGGWRFRGPVWPGDCYFPDFTDPQVRRWWGDLHGELLDAGVAGIWNDMNEPDIFGGPMAGNVRHRGEGHEAGHDELHNAYGLEMARAGAEGVRRLRPDERVPLISRSGYAGVQRYALLWTGDSRSTWEHLRLSVSMCLNLGLSGVALCGADVGGFGGSCTGELLVRWTQAGALMPFFRNHSALGTARQEPWAFGEPYESICRRWIELRYELLPAIYTAAWQAAQCGLPIMRPLVLAFPDDRRTYSLDDQFLLGDALLAAPVTQPGQASRPVYLPGGGWYDFWSGELCSGEISAAAPLERMPLFVRAGTVLPMGPVVQHTGEWPPAALSLHIYPGDGQSLLYEDDGHSLAYRHGELRLTRFRCETSGGRLRVRREVEGPFDPGYEQFEVTLHGQSRPPAAVTVDGRGHPASYDAAAGTVRLSVGEWERIEVEGGVG